MPQSESKLFQVRLSEAEKRHIKALAASQGLTLRQATLQAFSACAEKLQSRASPAEPALGAPTGANVERPNQPKRAATPKQERRPADGRPTVRPGRGHFPSLGASSRAWLRRAAQLDWTKCQSVESGQGESGRIWVVRGTDAPLVEVWQSVADGHPILEIAQVFEITLQQLVAMLEFTAEGAGGGEVRKWRTEGYPKPGSVPFDKLRAGSGAPG